jgi:polyhydroxyalkanoate synthesis regulator phasin
MCTTRGDYIDEDTMSLNFSPTPGPVCLETRRDPIPEYLRRAIDAFEAEATSFAARFIPDHAERLRYMAKIREMSDGMLERVGRGEITAEEGQRLAQQLRNEIMETTRGATSDIGRSWAEALKRQGRTLAELQEKYGQILFKREFAKLSEAEQGEVFLEVIKASGRAEPAVVVTSLRLAQLSRGLLFITAAVAVYQVATSDRPGREAVKQGTVIGTGVAGAALGGAVAGLACGPGAPVCVALFVFVAGGAAAFGVDVGFDRLWK